MSDKPERFLHLYDGRDLIGTIVDRGDNCDAFDRSGVHLGTFKKRKAAVSAVNSSLPVRVCDAHARRDGSP